MASTNLSQDASKSSDQSDDCTPSPSTVPPHAATVLGDDFFASLCATPELSASQGRAKSISRFAATRSVAPRPRPWSAPAAVTTVATAAGSRRDIRKMSSSCARAVRIGQAVLDAAAVVKELVENSLDAHATRVDVHLLGKAGCERIVVTDNGSGIDAGSHGTLCLPHATSKLAEFSDLEGISTFGFRGEALSAIAELCERVTVTTRTSGEQVGHRLIYDSNGNLMTRSRAPRRPGSTIQVDRLFARLPVRLQEAEKHSSRDIARCLAVMQSYALVASNVRFELRCGTECRLLTQPQPSASPTGALRAAIRSVLGQKQADVMIPCGEGDLLSTVVDAGVVAPEANTKNEPGPRRYAVSGFVSKSNHAGSGGGGRLSGSWQFFYLNGRPVDMPRVARAVNESYRRFALSSSASPAFILSFSVPRGTFDVNLSPDKRQVVIHREPALIEALQRHLESIWSPQEPRITPVNTVPSSQLEVLDGPSAAPLMDGVLMESEAMVENGVARSDPVGTAVPEPRNRAPVTMLPSRKRPKSVTLLNFISSTSTRVRTKSEGSSRVGAVEILSDLDAGVGGSTVRDQAMEQPSVRNDFVSRGELHAPKPTMTGSAASRRLVSSGSVQDQARGTFPASESPSAGALTFCLSSVVEERCRRKGRRVEVVGSTKQLANTEKDGVNSFACSVAAGIGELNRLDASIGQETDADREKAEQELLCVFKQAWFGELEIVGQFNKGFIVCLLHKRDLFVVDQHASDEKHNFEDLERNTVIRTQRLIRPMALDLAADEELLVLEHLERFKLSGFDIEHRPLNPPTQRLYLRSQPSSNRTMFVMDDLREIIATLQSGFYSLAMSQSILRPKRVRAMFASRACRKSVMIGTPLPKKKMESLVRQLEGLNHPWSCPHGRPTMRHLVNIERLE
jgi:DNA mismatch repair protein PMS2